MTKDILQIIAAVVLLIAFFSLLFRFVKPRGNQTDFIIGMLNRLSEGYEEGKTGCDKKRS